MTTLRRVASSALTIFVCSGSQNPLPAQNASRPDSARVASLKQEVLREVDGMGTFIQQMVDQIFSFGELGFQEVETSRYLVGILKKNGFRVEEGISGIPTAFMATWGSGRPVISLGSDIDDIPQANQKPGVAWHDALVPDAPGHGEGHNSGQAVNIAAALAVKKIMERERLSGTIKIWPGVAEELLGGKAFLVRDGHFKDADIVLFSHVGSNLRTSWGSGSDDGLISIEYTFTGQPAHSAAQPWRGRSALDAVELMNIGWNYRREHLRLQQRSHYVIRRGGDQPNVVPAVSSVWYYLRETDYPRILEMAAIADSIARGAALMTGTQLSTVRTLGAAWPRHFNRPLAEAMTANIKAVGLPTWTEQDQALAKAVQREVRAPEVNGLDTALARMGEEVKEEDKRGGGSDDIGDVSWVVPTITLNYPANIPGLPGHHWANAISMATPIAHKGSLAGARAQAMTMIDLITTPSLVDSAWSYFRNVQTKVTRYQSLLKPEDKPAIELNRETMAKYREQMRKYYFDPTKYRTYLEQLGIQYPTLAKPTP